MVAAAMLCGQVTAQSFTIPETTVPQGGKATLVVNYHFDSEGTYTGYQFDIALPEGFSLTHDANNNVTYTMSDCYANTHMIGANYVVAENVYNCNCLSLLSDPLIGTDGVLIKLEINADASLAVGQTYTGTLQNMALAKVNGQNVPMEDVSFTLVVGEPTTVPSEVTLTISRAGVGTYACAYDLDFTGLTGMKAYIASGFNPNNGKLVLTQVDEVPAGTGLYVKGTAGTYTVPVRETMMFVTNLLIGLTEATQVSPTSGDNTNFILANGTHGVGFYTLSQTGTIGAGKAYLSIPTSSVPAAANYIGLEFEDEEATGISEEVIEKSEKTAEAWYTVDGRKLYGEPTQKGVYIVNGRKVVIK